MELASKKCTLVLCRLFLVIQGMCGIDGVDEATTGVCGKNPSAMVYRLGPCAAAAQDKNVPVSRKCCDQITNINKRCLCAIILSKEAQTLGVKPQIAVTISKCRKLDHRPTGYKCEAYTVP